MNDLPSLSASSPSTEVAIDWFRHAAPYINAHRGRDLVLCLPGSMLKGALPPNLIHDLTLLSHLGLRLVVCFGLRAQLDDELAASQADSRIIDGRRVTSAEALQTIIDAAGRARNDLEARLSMGMPNTPMRGARLSVCSGNFVTAQPFGIHDGVDFLYTGAVREVQSEAISSLLAAGHLVLLSPLGHSLTGDVFNLPIIDVAMAAAIALKADKLVYFVEQLPIDEQGNTQRQTTATRIEQSQSADALSMAEQPGLEAEQQRILGLAARACRQGVNRVHLLRSDDPNALLKELFSVDGSGTLVTAEHWETLRPATLNDLEGIVQLIEPLQSNGSLVPRSHDELARDIERFVVSERDDQVVACAALYLDEAYPVTAEIACLATHEAYRGKGRAGKLLDYLESLARQAGCQHVRLLTTRTAHWFVERGYQESSPDTLPPARRARYDRQRNSKVYIKLLNDETSR